MALNAAAVWELLQRMLTDLMMAQPADALTFMINFLLAVRDGEQVVKVIAQPPTWDEEPHQPVGSGLRAVRHVRAESSSVPSPQRAHIDTRAIAAASPAAAAPAAVQAATSRPVSRRPSRDEAGSRRSRRPTRDRLALPEPSTAVGRISASDLRLGRPVAEGQFAVVVRATLWGQRVAVKQLKERDDAVGTALLAELQHGSSFERHLRCPPQLSTAPTLPG